MREGVLLPGVVKEEGDNSYLPVCLLTALRPRSPGDFLVLLRAVS